MRVTYGHEYVKDGEIIFEGESIKPDLACDYHVWTTVNYAGDRHAVHNLTIRLASRRLSQARGKSLAEEKELNFIMTNLFLKNPLKEHIADLLYRLKPLKHLVEELERTNEQHPKRKLRQAAHAMLMHLGHHGSLTWFAPHQNGKVKGCVKRVETLGDDKLTRMYVDMGVSSSLLGSYATEYMKKAIGDVDIPIGDGHVHFITTADQGKVDKVLKKVWNPPGKWFYVCFSDDAAYGVRTVTGVRVFELDISKCDASHVGDVFSALINTFPEPYSGVLQRLTRQCEATLKIKSAHNRKVKVELTPRTPRLYSGSTLTTLINSFASLTIGLTIGGKKIGSDGSEILRMVKENTGYVMRGGEVFDIEGLTLLKYHLVKRDDIRVENFWDNYIAHLCTGVLLRTSGRTHNPLPGKRDSLEQRGAEYQSALIQGLYPYTNWDLLDAMRTNLHTPRKKIVQHVERQIVKSYRRPTKINYTVNVPSLLKRYQLTDVEYNYMKELFRIGKCGEIGCSATTAILKLDYSLNPRFVNRGETTKIRIN